MSTQTTPLRYSIIIEKTDDPSFWCFFSPELPGFTGSGSDWMDAIKNAADLFDEYVELCEEKGYELPPPASNPTITLRTDPGHTE